MGLQLNVLGTMLLPLNDGRMADEIQPVCAVINDTFIRWLVLSGELEPNTPYQSGQFLLMSAETWIHAYQDNCHPAMIAEHSHERALYWLPSDLFVRTKNEQPINIGDEHEVNFG